MLQSYPIFLRRAFSLSLVGSILLSFNACQNNAVGQLRFQIAIANSAPFAIQAIPAQTESLRIMISGKGLNNPITQTIMLEKGITTYTREFSLPVGKKEVQVIAYQGEKALAKGSGSPTINANQNTPLSINLTPVAAIDPTGEGTPPLKGARLTLQGIIPIAIPLDIKISGEGLNAPLTTKATLPPGFNSSVAMTDTKLPVGDKQIELRLSLPNSDIDEKLPTIVQNFTVSATEETDIVLNLETLLVRYRKEIKDVPEFLASLQKYAPQLLLLLNISAETPTPSPLSPPPATTAPGNSSQIQIGELITATPKPSAVAETSFLAEVRLAYQKPDVLSDVLSNQLLELSDQGEYTLTQKQIWGLSVRTRQFFETGVNAPEYVLQIKNAAGELVTPFVRGSLNRSITTQTGIYRGGFIPFSELSEPLTLEAKSTYTVEWVLFSPGSNKDIRARYTFKTP